VHAAYHRVDVTVEERPLYGRGRPSPDKPRTIKALRYRLKTTISAQTERIARLEEEAGCFVLLTNVPTAGDLAHNASAILTVYKDQHGTEQNYGFLKDPVMVNSLFLKKPERIEALGLILLLALLLWRLMERTMRTYVDTTSTPLPGWDKKATERPTSFMMVTKFAGVIVLHRGDHRQLARPLSVVQQQYLQALDVPVAYFTGLKSGAGGGR
jgi:transposase